MIQDYPVSEQPTWRLIAQEVLGIAAAAVLFPFGIRQSQRRTPRQRNQRTVVLVHGYLANRSTLFPLAARDGSIGVSRWARLTAAPTGPTGSGRVLVTSSDRIPLYFHACRRPVATPQVYGSSR